MERDEVEREMERDGVVSLTKVTGGVGNGNENDKRDGPSRRREEVGK